MDKQETHLAAAETLSQSASEQPEHFFDPFRKEVRPVEAVRHHAHLLTQPSAYEAVHNEAYDRLIEEIADKDLHSEFVDECISELKTNDERRRAIGLKPMSDIWAELSAHEMWAVNILMQQMDAPPKKRSFINAYRKRTNSRKNRK